MNNYNPLVSIAIITYNSALTIIDSLESAFGLNYKNIELIISDDHSSDNTVELINGWILTHKNRFVRTKVITVEKNTYTSANCQRVLLESRGEWICIFAGDDILYPDAINEYVDYIDKHPNTKWLIGKHQSYYHTFEEKNIITDNEKNFPDKWKKLFDYDANSQLKIMLDENFIKSPSAFQNREFLLSIGGFDEKYGVLEDLSINLKSLIAGAPCRFVDKYTMGYRIGDTNVCSNINYLFSLKHQHYRYLVLKDLCFPYYRRRRKVNVYMKYKIAQGLTLLHMNKKNFANLLIYKTLIRVIDLFFDGPKRK